MAFMNAGPCALFLCLISPLTFVGQSTAQPTLPTDATALMSEAHEKNGLNSADVKPWHIRARYTMMTQDGKPEDTGVYEEWWFAPNKYKRSYTSAKFKQVDYATGAGLFREGSQDWAGKDELLVRSLLIEPLPDVAALKEFVLKRKSETAGPTKLDCVVLTFPLRSIQGLPPDLFPKFCFEPSAPALRISVPSGVSTENRYVRIVIFQGHYVASEMNVTLRGQPSLDVKLEVIEGIREAPESILSPTANALPVDLKKVTLKAESGGPVLLKGVSTAYPGNAKHGGIQGAVVLQVKIGKDGHVTVERVISGHPDLQRAATETVSQWIYTPFRVMGEAVEVTTEIIVVFQL
jgi:TonB family protein